MSRDGCEPVRIRILRQPPAGWERFLARVPDAELAADAHWSELAARHYAGGRPCWLVAESAAGDLLGGISLVARRRWQTVRLESSLDGTVAGPQIAADLPPDRQDAVLRAMCRGLLDLLGGRTTLVAFTVAAPALRRRLGALLAGTRWRLVSYDSAVVDCRPGLQQVEAHAWTNNRRNERNRGLKRGCVLQVDRDPELLADWYPLYFAQAVRWRQAPVPRAFLVDLLHHYQRETVVTTVRLDGRLVGGHFCLVSRRRLVPYLSAADAELARTHFLHTLLYWQDIVHACAVGLEAVDFGGCVGRDSLWDFKRRCGGQPEARLQVQAISRTGRWLARLGALRGRNLRQRS